LYCDRNFYSRVAHSFATAIKERQKLDLQNTGYNFFLYQGDKSAKDARFNVLVHYIGDEPDMPVKRHLIWSSPMMGSETHEKIYAKLVDLQTRFNAPMRMWCADGVSINGVSHLRFGPENLVAKWREEQGPLLRWWCSNHRLDISLSRPWCAKGVPILHDMLSDMDTFFCECANTSHHVFAHSRITDEQWVSIKFVTSHVYPTSRIITYTYHG
jgi:hypothetical protein